MAFSTHRRRARTVALALTGLGVAPLGCSKATPPVRAEPRVAEPAEPDGPRLPPGDSRLSRCHREGNAVALGAEPSAGPVVVGDGVGIGSGYAIGLARASRQGQVAAIAWVDPEVTEARVVDIAPTLGYAPPPRIARRADGLVAGYYVRSVSPEAKGVRRLALVAIDPQGTHAVRPLAMSFEQADESLAFDLAFESEFGLLVWDEVAGALSPSAARLPDAGGRGVIRGVVIDRDSHLGASFDVSPPASDAEAPRVVRGPSGFFVLWIAAASELVAELDAGSNRLPTEATGEARTNGWIEMLALDVQGSPRGPVVKLTPERGHVSSYDVVGLERGTSPGVLVVARDDGELADGTGGTLLLVRATDGGADAPAVLSSGGLGRGAPAIVDAQPPWVTWVGDREDLRMLPIVASGRSEGVASAEESLGEARPLLGMVGPPTRLSRVKGELEGGREAPPSSIPRELEGGREALSASMSGHILAVVPAPRDENVPTVTVLVCSTP